MNTRSSVTVLRAAAGAAVRPAPHHSHCLKINLIYSDTNCKGLQYTNIKLCVSFDFDVLPCLILGQTEIVRILIENGAQPSLTTDNGWTPAHFAAESGKLPVLRYLHSVSAPIDMEDCYGNRPVRIAKIYGHTDCHIILMYINNKMRPTKKEHTTYSQI
uniref:Uncharacterized protein n=1 Tax=Astyanax mexicanus TaxID=7994 RepID=W5JZ90_ASTMX